MIIVGGRRQRAALTNLNMLKGIFVVEVETIFDTSSETSFGSSVDNATDAERSDNPPLNSQLPLETAGGGLFHLLAGGIKLFSLPPMLRSNKLECLSLASLFSLQ